ncbi:MAG: DUF3089 domain-containing protein [Flavobacteriales bacterium]|nr:DUF3089 domain-containing protein [Flavobacteriales bacterium]
MKMMDSIGICLVGMVLVSGCATLQDPSLLQYIPPPAPNYDLSEHWASLPHRLDPSDEWPKNLPESEALDSIDVDVFFLYPTQYFKGEIWHAGPENEEVNLVTDNYPMRLQASAFNIGGRLYAPRYRQAHIGVFTWQDSLSSEALELAYEDVRAAFMHYLEHWNDGRGIILAGHSQGSWHERWLIQEFFDGQPLAGQLVAAYGPGFDWYASDFQRVPICKTPTQTGCVCSWMSYGEGYFPQWLGHREESPICTHPVTWEWNGGLNALEDHRGVVLSQMKFTHQQKIQAFAERGVLQIKSPDVPFSRMLHRDNWHIGDINLFWLNIRDNARARAEAFLKR